jgi:hypothetical protein
VTTITRTAGSASASRRIQRYSVCIRPVQALRRFGRASVTTAIPSVDLVAGGLEVHGRE